MTWLLGSSVVVLASVLATAALAARKQLDRQSAWIPALGVLALPVLGFGVAVTSTGGGGTRASSSQALGAVSSIAWPESTPAGVPPPGHPATAAGSSTVASVSSLVGGLKARLQQSPDDPNGWALLATSLAFTGDQAGAEQAMEKAVSLGVDAEALRKRIAAAGASSAAQSQGGRNDAAQGR